MNRCSNEEKYITFAVAEMPQCVSNDQLYSEQKASGLYSID